MPAPHASGFALRLPSCSTWLAPLADDGGVAFEEIVHEGVEAFADAGANGEESVEGARASSRLFTVVHGGVEIASEEVRRNRRQARTT